ncbi:C69 family dipeptidase [Pseudomonas panipatensis]|uniref:Dipeptidase n=1 Tax=Pseudomonas panipatensis TaxID=428992 RepID=A0A1G8MFD6_9PSED|nr:C69 family dipeptidase [Pseudomonas panipatensis]SDI66582.1 Dipeptidase [Pseudomonas panipatensis]SMP76921.1 Dipeptidase [Pseudomonas panipatensis]
MCDTLVLRGNGVTWFAKNSDREPVEPQRLLRLPAVRGDSAARLHTTYLDIPQTADRHALILSQPSWIWGAEMGVNEHGVAIGNQAVFTCLTSREGEALLGMDLLRLGLERGASAREALEVITQLLERHGQGGPAGFRNKRMRYDNSFLIADAGEAWVLETAGRLWAAKRVERWAISNALSLGHEFDLCSADLPGQARRLGCWNGRGDFHFARTFDGRLLPWIAGAHQRRRLNQEFLDNCPSQPDWQAMVVALRNHGPREHNFARHDNRQVCMHAGSFWRPSQTTGSLIARLDSGGPRLAATGTSAPCLSLFQPLGFDPAAGACLLSGPDDPVEQSLWWRFESVHRRALADPEFAAALRSGHGWLEGDQLAALDRRSPDWARLAAEAEAWHAAWQQLAGQLEPRLPRWWRQHAAP